MGHQGRMDSMTLDTFNQCIIILLVFKFLALEWEGKVYLYTKTLSVFYWWICYSILKKFGLGHIKACVYLFISDDDSK